jgi:hypothetical protein
VFNHQPLSTHYLLDLVADQAGDEDELELDDRLELKIIIV